MADNYVITIAREHGSQGNKVGKIVADRLGIAFYDYKLLRLASDRSGISEELFGAADEDVHRRKIFNAASKVYTGKLLPPDSDEFTSDLNLFTFQAEIIKELASNENCVIVGRCSEYILRDRKRCVRVYLYADMDSRIARATTYYGLPTDKAREKLQKMDKKRASYHNFYTGMKWGQAENYDLAVNTASLGVDGTVELIRRFVELREASAQ